MNAIALGMISRSPHRRAHILDVFNNVQILDNTDMLSGSADCGLPNFSEERGFFVHQPWFNINKETGKLSLISVEKNIMLNCKFNPKRVAHLDLLAHELGHAVNSDLAYCDETEIQTERINASTRKYKHFMTGDGRFSDTMIYEHASGVCEALNCLHTEDLTKKVFGKAMPHNGLSLMLWNIRKKYGIKAALLEADETNDYQLFHDTINKKVKTTCKPPSALVTDGDSPAHVLTTYLDLVLENLSAEYNEKSSRNIRTQTTKIIEYLRLKYTHNSIKVNIVQIATAKNV